MLEILFTVGQTISLLVLMYGAFVAIDYSFFAERQTKASVTADELPEIGRYLSA